MLRLIAILFGVAFIFAGVAGFLPSFTQNGMLFYTFEVSDIHNIVHIVTGVIAIMAATNYKYTRLYFQIFGVIYLLVTLAGFWRNGDLMIMGHTNLAGNFLHLGISIVALYLGFFFGRVSRN